MKFLSDLFKSKNDSVGQKKKVNVSDFQSPDAFWKFVTQNRHWYLDYLPQQFDDLQPNLQNLASLISDTLNDLRYSLEFKNDDYWNILQWDNVLLELKLHEALKQYCSNCKIEMNLLQRYPRAICHDCTKNLTSPDGRKVEFFNSEAMGYGCQGFYSGTNQKEKYDSNECQIGTKDFIANEARFGGIVIELKE